MSRSMRDENIMKALNLVGKLCACCYCSVMIAQSPIPTDELPNPPLPAPVTQHAAPSVCSGACNVTCPSPHLPALVIWPRPRCRRVGLGPGQEGACKRAQLSPGPK
jgi:hypothetical protein